MHSISSFITTHADQDRPDAGPFEVENRATLQVNLQGTVYAKAGAMVAGPLSRRARTALSARGGRAAALQMLAMPTGIAALCALHRIPPRTSLAARSRRPSGHRGNVKFSRKGTLEDGVGKFLKKAVTGEGMTLMKMEGNGRVVLADRNKRVHVLALQRGESLCVNGNDLLVLQSTLDWDVVMLRSMAGALAGGLFNVQIAGQGSGGVSPRTASRWCCR